MAAEGTSPEQNALDNMGSVSNTETRKPTSSTPIPEQAIEAVVGPKLTKLTGRQTEIYMRAQAHEDLSRAYPHLLSAFRAHLLGDEAVAQMLTFLGERGWGVFQDGGDPAPDPADLVDSTTSDLRGALEAALSEVGL